MSKSIFWSRQWLYIFIILMNVVGAIVFGATFWIDSFLYIDLAYYLDNFQLLSNFYTPIFTCISSHFSLLPSYLWMVLSKIFGIYTFPAYVIVQRLLASVALIYLVKQLERYFPRKYIVFPIATLLVMPYYHSIHNMVMTESMMSSFLILIVASSIRLANIKDDSDKHKLKDYIIFSLSAFLGVQVRPQMLIFSLCLLLVLLIINFRNLFKKAVLLVSACIIGYLFFPVLRYIHTGMYFAPNIDCLAIRSSLMSVVGKKTESREILNSLGFPDDVSIDRAVSKGLTYEESLSLWNFQVSLANGDEDIARDKVKEYANKIRLSDRNVIQSQIESALSGVGIINSHIFFKDSDVFSEGLTKAEWSKHYNYHYRWLSWTTNDNKIEVFDDFANRVRHSGWYSDNTYKVANYLYRPYIYQELYFQSILAKLAMIRTDYFAYLWLLSILWQVYKRRHTLALLMSITVILNYFAVLFVGFGNIRYFYSVFPITIISGGLFLSELLILTLRTACSKLKNQRRHFPDQ